MKFLVASVGNTLESFVARRFEHAVWYLIVDGRKSISHAIQHKTPHDRHTALEKALEEQIDVVIAGKLGESSIKILKKRNVRVAPLHGVSGSAAMALIRSREVIPVEAESLELDKGMNAEGKQRGKLARRNIRPSAFAHASDSPRGHYHLQQYGGRGH